MAAVRQLTQDIFYVGVNDHEVDLFEGHYDVPNGMAYNSYVIRDYKIAVMDTVDQHFTHEWLDNLDAALQGKKPDYLVVQHMEPDHSANIAVFLKNYPEAEVVATDKAFAMMQNFFGNDYADRRIVVKEGDTLPLGRHVLHFVQAPMVHWPEVMMTYDAFEKTLFSADAFGKFGALDVEEEWDCEARRYYFGIVGKYGAQVQNVLKKAAALDIQRICPLHGPVLTDTIGHVLDLYQIWSSYGTETEGVAIFYTSVYGHTKEAVELLAAKLKAKGCPKINVTDLAREDWAEAVEDAFRYGRIVLASTTYNAGVFPPMRDFLENLAERNWQNKTVAFIENGSWAPQAKKTMQGLLQNCKNLNFTEHNVKILSALDERSKQELEDLAAELCTDYVNQHGETANKNDLTALFKIGYGLYVITSNNGKNDNGFICNTVTQVTSQPNRVAVCINKQNYSHHVIQTTGVMNVNCLDISAPFEVFKCFGFQSGRNVDKFENNKLFTKAELLRSDNGLVFLPRFINAVMSLKVFQYIDLGTHGMFICDVTEARVLSKLDTMTYTYYQNEVKPKPETQNKKGWVCKVCGYIYEGDPLPEDFICPLCKHGAADFEKLS